MSDETDLSVRLQTVIDEIRDVWKSAETELKSCVRKLQILNAIMKSWNAP